MENSCKPAFIVRIHIKKIMIMKISGRGALFFQMKAMDD